MKLKITIEMDNAAFDPPGTEAARILRELAAMADGVALAPGYDLNLRDANGNRVGKAQVTR